MVPMVRLLIDIGYKYNTHKFLSFVVTDDAWITKSDHTYLYKHPDKYSNGSNSPVSHPLVMYKFFEYFNEVDYHNKSRQSDLAL